MALLRNKKAQQEGGGTKAAALVAIIAGLVLLYILFLPPSEREKLLDNKTAEKQIFRTILIFAHIYIQLVQKFNNVYNQL